jgi:hypothetical protein
VAVLAAAGAGFAQPAASAKIDLKGSIEKVQVARGQGMPSLYVKTGSGTVRVILGSFRYLIEQDFNPKAGAEIHVKGFKVNDDVMAITVSLPSEGKTLKLRDEEGRPVWMRGRRGPPRCENCK